VYAVVLKKPQYYSICGGRAYFIWRMKVKVALYARVSLEEGNKDDRRYQEPENQLEPLREWAKNQNLEVVEEFIDRGSGADPNRPQFRLMLQKGMMMQFQEILVWKLDRFSREPMNQVVGRVQSLRDRGIGIRSLTESWLNTSKDNPMSDLVLAIMSWAAGEERRKISERTKVGIARRRAIGQWHGGRPKRNPPQSDIPKDPDKKGTFLR
jgi:DNA invertase Pin-like site-specific DNA recombinase